ncbi:DNRLRE domain-containing protein [Kribbella qitaiheensis]|uniref:DNRLRE domain-containing protein n=1 Tax=Kribbella qitaiheensis TaxID=1544730 RepID=A0A7G6WUW0_9ACTN|nr:DNRLRE domain-containing protein [Kribbella qitaiheensis]QNE17775.1 DNRLRE domain-containing protein [Kribbella qitaiheensis]
MSYPRSRLLRVYPGPRSARWIGAAVVLALVAGLLSEPPEADAAAVQAAEAAAERAAIDQAVNAVPLERPDEASAAITSRTTGKPVLITSRTTDTTEYRAMPSGKIEATIAAGPVRMRGTDGDWIEVDVSLVRRPDGSIVSKAHPYGLELSGAAGPGDHTLVALGAPGNRSALGWSGPLRAPVLSGTTATYREVKPGVDLIVEATRTGYQQHLLVKNRAAAARLQQIRMPWKADGVTAKLDGSGGLAVRKDGQSLDVPAPLMWDSTVDQASGEHTRRAQVGLGLAKDALLLTPSRSFLNDPKTVYPVTIDPSQSSGANFDAFVQNTYTTDQSAATELKLGTYDGGGNKAKSYLRFDNQEWLWDKQIQAATLNLWEHHSFSCAARGWEAWRTADVTNTARWTKQPTEYERVGTSTQTKGFSTACGDGWVTIPVTAAFQYTATNHLAKTNLGIKAASETDNYGWKRFASREAAANPPSVTLTYQTKTAVNAQATAPDTVCGSGATRPYISSLTPQLRAQISDGLSAQVYANFEWKTVGGTTSTTATEGPGASGSWLGTTIADGAFAEGGSYAWRVQGSDGTTPGAWSQWCEFTVDTISPAVAPTVSSTTYPVSQWSGGAGTAGIFTFGASGVSDAAAYEYGVDSNPPDQVANASSPGATTTVTITPTADGPHTLWVRTRDRAGNRSPLTAYEFAVGGGAVLTPKAGDISAAKTAITGAGRTTATGVTYQWRRGDTDAWVNIPAAHVQLAAGGGAVSWPLPTTGGGLFPKLNWNIEATLAAVDAQSVPRDGPLQLRGSFTGGTAASSGAVKLTFDRNLASAASQEIGPGDVNLLTGNVTLSDTDVSVNSYGSDLTVSRTYNSRQSAKTDPSGMFGPGWISGAIVDEAETPYTSLDVYGSLLQVGTPDGDVVGFTARDGVNFDPEVGQETLRLTYASATDTYKLTDDQGTIVMFGRVTGSAAGKYFPTATTLPGSNQTTTYVWERVTVGGAEVVRPTRVLAPVPDGVSCSTMARGCRALNFTYATTTTATGTAEGDYAGRVKEISFTAWDPDLATPAMRTVPMARYGYDSAGRLRSTWDPRIATNGKETYDYQADGVLSTVKPAGEEPWLLSYTTVAGDPGIGRLLKVTRSALTAGTAVETVVYKVPLSGAGAPNDLSPAQTRRWGQPEAPTDATAIFPADQVPNGSSWERATVSYLDANGRQTNEAKPGGNLTTTWYDGFSNEIRSLTAENRNRALNQSPSDNEVAEQTLAQNYSTVTSYSLDGMRVETILDPETEVRLTDGTTTRGRQLNRKTYDQGAPTSGGPYNLVTTEDVQVRVWGSGGTTVEADRRTTTTGYNWTLRQPTVTTTDPGGLGQTVRSTLDPVTGLETSTTQVAGGSTTNTPATRKTINYRASAGSGFAECDLHPEWANLPCRVQPGGQAASGPELAATVTTYDIYNQERVETEKTSAGTLRTTTTTYDAAGRVLDSGVVGLGTPLPIQRNVYDPVTGDLLRNQSVSGGTVTAEIVRTYDTLGRVMSYKDADGNLSTTAYDMLGRAATTNDGRSSRSYGYDFRGLLNSVTDGQTGTYTGAYDADGKLVSETWPNGVKVDSSYDEAGQESGITYSRPGCASGDCTLFREVKTQAAQGQTARRVSTLSSQVYLQDKAGRVSTVEETVGEKCVTRVYGFSTATDRTSSTEYGPAADGSCQTASPAAGRTWTYDTANRVNTTGYVYDALGRTTKVPAIDTGAPAGGDVTATYHANDLVDTISQGGRSTDYTIDVTGERVRSWTDNSTGEAVQNVQHYDGDEDSPVWTQEGPDRWTRVVPGLAGMSAVLDSDSGVPEWQLSDLSGDIVATIHDGDEGLSTTSEAGEYGVLSNSEAVGKQRYGWLGAEQRAADAPSGIVLMGVRLYNPTTGRFLQTDPVYGGSCNAYEYTCADPVDKYDLNGKWMCWSKKCALKYAAKKWKAAKKKIRKNKYVRKVWRFSKKVYKNRYVRACAGGALGVLTVDTIKNGWKALRLKWFRWGPAGCAGGVIMYHARRNHWW